MKKSIAAGLGFCAVSLAFAAKDPVIMTVNGIDVPKSEFEYLYNKNSQQQINPQTLEEYVEMFKLYKMKVADAKAEGIDTLKSFRKEIDQYRHELAAPYLADSVYINQLVGEAFDRSRREVDAYHIMFFKKGNAKVNKELRQRMDSIRTELLKGADFGEMAAKYSEDRGSKHRGGHMNYIQAGQYPYSFEVVDFALPEGEISEVVESPVGYHVLKGGKSRPARGKVKVAHILRLAQTPEQRPAAKAAIDSLYKIAIQDPAKFAELATANSEDPGSARQGGNLPWFGSGEMVAEFDSVAFAMPKGTISEPFATSYGYHIIYKQDEKGLPTLEEMKPGLLSRFNNPQDERYKMIRDHQTTNIAIKHKAKVNDKGMTALRNAVATNGLDSAFYANWTVMPLGGTVLAQIDGKSVPAYKFVKSLNNRMESDGEDAAQMLDRMWSDFYAGELLAAEENRLAAEVPDYRNLLKEYEDGSLLYEVSVRKVWDKAAKDAEGLEKFFNEHRQDYKWTTPHVKGYFVQAVNDSVGELIKARAAELKDGEIVPTIRKEFKGQGGIEKVLVAKGGNPMVDYVAFGGPKVESSVKNYPVFFMINARIVDQPEEVSDVKGQVTSDYQNQYQEAWENELRAKYPVKINEKVLKQVKRK